jgi:hypothetical protein
MQDPKHDAHQEFKAGLPNKVVLPPALLVEALNEHVRGA